MTWQSGGSGGVPGVTSDGQTPGGEVIAGGLAVGDPDAATRTPFSAIRGSLGVVETPANQQDSTDILDILQDRPLLKNNQAYALWIGRQGTLNGFDYTNPAVNVQDDTAAVRPLVQVSKLSVTQFQVDGDGVQVHGKFKTGASVTHTLGAYSGNSVPIYNEAGTLLGYMPLYA